MTILKELFDLAEKHITDERSGEMDSAKICISDAYECIKKRPYRKYASDRILKSLAYSVSVFHEDYQKALELKEQLLTFGD